MTHHHHVSSSSSSSTTTPLTFAEASCLSYIVMPHIQAPSTPTSRTRQLLSAPAAILTSTGPHPPPPRDISTRRERTWAKHGELEGYKTLAGGEKARSSALLLPSQRTSSLRYFVRLSPHITFTQPCSTMQFTVKIDSTASHVAAVDHRVSAVVAPTRRVPPAPKIKRVAFVSAATLASIKPLKLFSEPATPVLPRHRPQAPPAPKVYRVASVVRPMAPMPKLR